jgi:hypothetical protein
MVDRIVAKKARLCYFSRTGIELIRYGLKRELETNGFETLDTKAAGQPAP